ncbi:histidine kinase [Chitinophaga agrisoli]|uniref:Histidine kinase n=1 Tax=Chitinophaga agrisoli TaxID=2607653 RepID=A0A5B2VRS9_9BACT|nr:histidine kinase [Chitinophaga agrisoli]KAA2241921.1 histidine kinase [Chitinophaga agrisoli]
MSKGIRKPLIYLISLLILAGIAFLGYNAYYEQVEAYEVAALIWIFTVIMLLWLGNRYIYQVLDKDVSWLRHPTRRFFIQLAASGLYSLLCINLTYYLFKITTNSTPPDPAQVLVLNVYGLLFIIPVLSVNFGIYFMMQWKKAQVQANQLKEDNLQAQLNSLRMQLDPHFLFNNLNVLASLIDKDKQEAQSFLDKFADVYRYVLQYKKEELVPLHTELDFIKAYGYLLKKRFGDAVLMEMPTPQDIDANYFIPPLSLQMLMENAVKHNIISKDDPLRIQVYLEGKEWVIVKNTYQPIPREALMGSGTGLDNIRKRYQYLSAFPVDVSCDNRFFTVKLPLLEIEE